MKDKSPQEKKELSYAKDCRNSYGQNDKASRKTIPKRKAEVNRVYRRDISNVLKAVIGPIDLDVADQTEHVVRSVNRVMWKKCPDTPLGKFVERKIKNRVKQAGMVNQFERLCVSSSKN